METTVDLGNDLGWALGVIFRAYVKASRAATADIPGGHRGFQVLTAAASAPPGNQRTIAQRLGIDRTVMTYLIDDMEKAGLLERQADPADRRTRLIVATDHGRSTLDELCRRLNRLESHILAGLPDDEQASLKSSLQRLAGRINEFDPVTNACEVIESLQEQ